MDAHDQIRSIAEAMERALFYGPPPSSLPPPEPQFTCCPDAWIAFRCHDGTVALDAVGGDGAIPNARFCPFCGTRFPDA
jgi:hypothetical protein